MADMPRAGAVTIVALCGLFFIGSPVAAAVLDASWTAPTTNTDGSQLNDLTSYRVYYATTTSPCRGASFFQIASSGSSPSPGQQVSFKLTGLTANTRYYVAVSAVDAGGNESGCSSVATAVAQAAFTVNPTGSLNFGSVNLGGVVTRTFTVSTTRGGTVSGTVSTSAPFSIASGGSFTLNGANATHTVTVRFAPTALAAASANLSFNAAGDSVSLLLSGTGTGTGPDPNPNPGPETVRPTVAISSPTTGTTFRTSASSLTLAGTASDNVGVTQVTWLNNRGGSGTAAGTTSWTASGIGLQTGTNVLTITARDAAGNTATDTLTVTRDTTAAALTITSPTSNGTYSTPQPSLTLAGTVSSNAGVTQVRWANNRGGSGTASGTTSWTASGIGLQIGTNVVTVTGRAASGSTLTDTLTVTRTGIRPTIAITSPTTSSTYRTRASILTLRGTASDDSRVTQVTWVNSRGGSGTATGTTSWTASGIRLQPGSNVLTLKASDPFGNTGADSLTVILDTTGPQLTITSPTANGTYTTTRSSLTLGGTASDNVGVTLVRWVNSRGGSGTATGTTNWTAGGIILQAGTNVVTVTALDAAGNGMTDLLTITRNP
jgi:Glucodextranase, domain B/Bacterial Ig domain